MIGATFEFRAYEITVTADRAAGVVLGTGRVLPDPKRLLYLVNKANKSDQTRMRQGSPEWQRIQDFEQAIRAAGLEAVQAWEEDNGKPWPIEAERYSVFIGLSFGDRVLQIPATPRRRAHTKRETAASRAKCHDVDGVKSILDALQGILFANDNQVTSLSILKDARPGGIEGDRVVIMCVPLPARPKVLEEDGRQTDKHAERGASRAAASSASRPPPRSKRST